jgi:PST family polysaccharide transporter
MQDLREKAVRSGLAKLIGQGCILALRLGYMVVIARMLVPDDFGLVAMATIVTATFELFASAGLSVAAVQKSTISEEQMSSLFWINIIVGLVLCLLCAVAAPFLVAFFREPRLFWIMVVLGAGFLFNAAGVQHIALLQRQLRYPVLAVLEFCCQLTSLGIGVCMAVAGYDYWALVVATVVMPMLMTNSVWVATGWIPGRPRWNTDVFSLLQFGGTVTLNGLVSYLTYNFDKFILGRVWGATQLGNYGVASQLLSLPTNNFNMAIGGVMFSVLSRLQDDSVSFKIYFLKGYSFITAVILPTTIFAAAFPNDIVAVVLGPQWPDAAHILRLLVPAVLVFGLINPLGWLMWSSGYHKRSLRVSVVIAPIVVAGCLSGLPYGSGGVAFGFSAAMLLWVVPHVIWCVRGTSVAPLDLVRAASRPFVSAIVAVSVAYAVQPYFILSNSAVSRLIQEVAIVTVTYAVMLLFVMGQKSLYLDVLRAAKLTVTPAPPRAGRKFILTGKL